MEKVYVSVESITYADGLSFQLKIILEHRWDETWDIKRVIHMAEPWSTMNLKEFATPY